MQPLALPLPLTGAKNIRDLGGYRTESGYVTKSRAFLRADCLNNLSDEDCRFLYEYGIRLVVDLRSRDERERAEDRLHRLYPDIEYLAVGIQEQVKAKRYREEFPPSMWELYCWFFEDSREGFKDIFEAFARYSGGYSGQGVLFHCSGGKDRTGMVAMLLLKLAGVDNETVVRDYAQSESLMKDLFVLQTKEMESRGLVVPAYIMESPPSNMEKALAHMESQYGTARNYLESIGLGPDTLKILKAKLTDEE